MFLFLLRRRWVLARRTREGVRGMEGGRVEERMKRVEWWVEFGFWGLTGVWAFGGN